MFYIHVLRIKCETLPQADFLRSTRDPVDVISRSFEGKPTADVGRGSEWHIGNIENIESEGIGFAMGRTQAVKSPRFDTVNHDFLEEEAMRAPFTIGVFDKSTQTCGIIRKTGVSQSSSEIAGKLQILLNSAGVAAESNSHIVVDPIPDPVSFIEAIRDAEAVTRFSFTVTRPNPQDVNRLIQKPAEEFTEAIDGEKARIEVEGDSLNKSVVEDVAKATAAVGETATANIRPAGGGRTKRIYLTGNAVVEPVDAGKTQSVFAAILTNIRSAYVRIRTLTI
jgi:hypothetical protein